MFGEKRSSSGGDSNLRLPTPAIASWWKEVPKTWRFDLIAGLTLWGMVVPEAIAYAGLAGVPPLSGVWAVVFVLPFYVIFGSSRHLVATPTSAASVTAGGIIVSLGLTNPDSAVMGLAAVTMCVGAVFLLMWLFKLGFFVNFISQPINAGFMFGLALFIVISQLPKVLGVEGGDGNAIERFIAVAGEIGETNLTTVGLGVVAFALLIGLPKLSAKIPTGLVALVVCTLLVAGFSLDKNNGVATVGALPTGMPSLVFPDFGFKDWLFILVGSIGLVLLAFSEASSVARRQAEEDGRTYDPERDLFAFSLGNLASGLVGGLPGAGSMSSTATNVSAGAKTQLSTAVTAVAALLTALYFGSIIGQLPEVALGALIIHAVWRHLSTRAMRQIAQYSPLEARIAALAAVGVLVLDVLYGLLLAMIVSLGWYVYLTAKVRITRVGSTKGPEPVLVGEGVPGYKPVPAGSVGLRFDTHLFYGNIDDATQEVLSRARAELKAHPDERHVALIDFGAQRHFDYTSAGRVHRMLGALLDDKVTVVIVGGSQHLFDVLGDYAPLPSGVHEVLSKAASLAIGLVENGGDDESGESPPIRALTDKDGLLKKDQQDSP